MRLSQFCKNELQAQYSFTYFLDPPPHFLFYLLGHLLDKHCMLSVKATTASTSSTALRSPSPPPNRPSYPPPPPASGWNEA